MSNFLFHNKYHRSIHHTVSSAQFPDSGSDPIASSTDPFIGTFFNTFTIAGLQITTNSNEWYTGYTVVSAISAGAGHFKTTFNTVTALSSNWSDGYSLYSIFSSTSAKYNFVYSYTNTNSANWPWLSRALRTQLVQENTGSKTFSGVSINPAISATIYTDFLNPDYITFNTAPGSIVTFTRASSATFISNFGILSTVDNNAVRQEFLYNSSAATWELQGVLVERSRTNLIVYSNDFTAGLWSTVGSNTQIIPSGDLGPDNTNAYYELSKTAANASNDI